MKNYLFVGDTHGDLDFLEQVFAYARENDVHDVVQVGDFGFVWNPNATLDYVSTLAQRYGVTLRWIDGNHENHARIRELLDAYSDAGEGLHVGGGYEFSPGVIYQPRGSTHTDEEGTTFLFCGGAPSIDHQFRVEGKSIWAELEIISDAEFERCLAVEERVDVIVTHDAPIFPPGYGPKGDPSFRQRGARSMELIRDMMVQHLPELLVHGHWHTRYATSVETRQACVSKVVGLDCNHAYFDHAVMLWSREEV